MRLSCALLCLLVWATRVWAGTVSLAWDGVPDARLTQYQVQRCLVLAPQTTCIPTDLPTALVGAIQTTYTDQGLAPGTYVYAVVSLAPGLRSGPSNLVMVTHNVNIANFSLGRSEQEQEPREAVSVVQVDSEVSDAVLQDLRKIEAVAVAKAIRF